MTVLLGLAVLIGVSCSRNSTAGTSSAGRSVEPTNSVELTNEQLRSLEVGPAVSRVFVEEHQAVGIVDFDQDRNVPVFAPYQGRIKDVRVTLGQDVRRGDALFTIESADLIQAESTLIATTAVLDLTTRALERAKRLYTFESSAQKDLDQARSDQQTAAANFAAARNALRNIFGKSEADIDRVAAEREIDGDLVVTSPIDGRVTIRNAAAGTFVQQGAAPAPITVADVSTMWLVAYLAESDLNYVHVGDPVTVQVSAYPNRRFAATVTTIGTAVDPATHRFIVRAKIPDPRHELLPQMLATFTIQTAATHASVGVPANSVVREGDGTLSVWVTTDRHTFTKREVQVGIIQDGFDEISSGLRAGELIATDGAIFVSNMLSAPASD